MMGGDIRHERSAQITPGTLVDDITLDVQR
jgi:hypothetical protein